MIRREQFYNEPEGVNQPEPPKPPKDNDPTPDGPDVD